MCVVTIHIQAQSEKVQTKLLISSYPGARSGRTGEERFLFLHPCLVDLVPVGPMTNMTMVKITSVCVDMKKSQ